MTTLWRDDADFVDLTPPPLAGTDRLAKALHAAESDRLFGGWAYSYLATDYITRSRADRGLSRARRRVIAAARLFFRIVTRRASQ